MRKLPGEPKRLGAARRTRKPLELSEKNTKRLAAYATMAATGVGALWLAPTAEAGIIYTPANTILTSGSLFIDLNHDGTNDVSLGIANSHTSGFGFRRLSGSGGFGVMVGHGTNGAHLVLTGHPVAPPAALAGGATIGLGQTFSTGRYFAVMAGVRTHDFSNTFAYGPWANVSDRYLGVEFDISGQLHFGWVRLDVSALGPPAMVTATLTGYAYETNPDQSILAGQTTDTPEPGTLGLLALGALGIAYRRRQSLTGKASA
jgi:hypothetical protein